jgi:hypothetical protein
MLMALMELYLVKKTKTIKQIITLKHKCKTGALINKHTSKHSTNFLKVKGVSITLVVNDNLIFLIRYF